VSVLAHARTGQGPRPLLLLHGFLGSARNLASLARGLADRDPSLSVFVLDLTGHGASPPLPEGADTATIARDVLATARTLDVPLPVRLVGHSLGGRVALRAGMLERSTLAHITLLDISPSPLKPGGDTTAVVQALVRAPDVARSREEFRVFFRAAGLADEVTDWLLLNLARDGDVVRWRIDRAALAALHARISGEDLWPAVEGPRPSSMHCVRGALSPYVDEGDARRLAAAGCPVDTIAGAGHFLHVEKPADTLERVLAGLR
jgi:pimeloyl-ACP methyl ester carboxylesterase